MASSICSKSVVLPEPLGPANRWNCLTGRNSSMIKRSGCLDLGTGWSVIYPRNAGREAPYEGNETPPPSQTHSARLRVSVDRRTPHLISHSAQESYCKVG